MIDAQDLSDIDDLIARGAPKHPYFEVVIETGDVITFRYPSDHAELRATKIRGTELAREWAAGRSVKEHWKPFLSSDEATLNYVAVMSAYCVGVRLFRGWSHPEEHPQREAIYKTRGPFEHLDFLKLQKQWAAAFEALRNSFNDKVAVATINLDVDSIEAAKKD